MEGILLSYCKSLLNIDNLNKIEINDVDDQIECIIHNLKIKVRHFDLHKDNILIKKNVLYLIDFNRGYINKDNSNKK